MQFQTHHDRAIKRQRLAAAFSNLSREIRDTGTISTDVQYYQSLAEWHYLEARRSVDSILAQQLWERINGE